MNLLSGLRANVRYIYPVIVLAIASAVFAIGYNTPRALFWDENYHIASAQKYLDGAMFMESHPPLGKMLLAFGEWVLGANKDKDKSKFLRVDHLKGRHLPPGMSFAGFRLMPVLLMVLAAPLFYFILVHVLGNRHLAFLFSSLFLFDNALVVHTRGAMLEGIQLFFAIAAIWYCVRTVKGRAPVGLGHYAVLGALIGSAIAVKVNSAVLLLLFVMLYGCDQWFAIRSRAWKPASKRFAAAVPVSVGAVSAVLLGVMYLHIALGTQIISGKTYEASPEYIQIVRRGETATLSAFAVGLRDNWDHMSGHADTVPELDVCKDGENGSHPTRWPLGGKTINYRWGRTGIDGQAHVRYLYLVGNPVIWLSVLAGIALSVILIGGRFIYGLRLKETPLFYWTCAFTGLYVSYMIAILQIGRVMYMYHYLLPLVFGMLNLSVIFSYIYREEILQRSRHVYANAVVFVLIVLAAFWHFAPLSYYMPLTKVEFSLRQWFDVWKLAAVW